jgi:predicted aminopeptidase
MARLARIATLLLLFTLLGGCSLPYYWQAAGGQMQLLAKRTSIAALLDDPDTDPALRARLETVVGIRQFAIDELGLPDNRSYTTYADLGRPFAVWNVVAAPEFSVQPETWCFPVAGCVSYRGFFRREAAERFQARLDARGFDTYLGGVRAYSTLGFFADPVLNTMLAGSDTDLAALLFHELAHQRLYIRDDSALSEAFASAIEQYGTELWLTRHGDEGAVALYHERLARRSDFAALVARQRDRLALIYARDDPEEVMREAKRAAFVTLQDEYRQTRSAWGDVPDYDAWFAQPLNNAIIAAVVTYEGWLPALRARIDEVGLAQFYADMDELAGLAPEAREARLTAWRDS